MKLLTMGNPKTVKGEDHGYLTAILHLAPYDLSGRNVCPWASAGCVKGCLNTAGRGGIIMAGRRTNKIHQARKRKTRYFFSDRGAFMADLVRDIRAHIRATVRHGLRPAVRLNGTSDLTWERIAPELFETFPDVQFYDYTKGRERAERFIAGKLPANYHLTFSRSESNHADVKALVGRINVAIVTRKGYTVPATYMGADTVNGDLTDLRFLDPVGAVVELKAKGKARKDTSGFVIQN